MFHKIFFENLNLIFGYMENRFYIIGKTDFGYLTNCFDGIPGLEEASSNFEHAEGSPVWVDMLTVFVVLFAFGLGGVYFIRRYRKVHLIESYKPCNITYNARTQNI